MKGLVVILEMRVQAHARLLHHFHGIAGHLRFGPLFSSNKLWLVKP
jgi:hypothetical protein